jgi:ferredoxin
MSARLRARTEEAMAYVISRLCRDCVDTSCVEQCPVDCIVEHRPPGSGSDLPKQLFIDPEECISCGLCPPACPWDAIYEEDELPAEFAEDAALNALTSSRRGEFATPELRSQPAPTLAEVAANKKKWGAE